VFRTSLLAASLLLLASVSSLRAESAPSFTNDVIPIFTRYGCNQGNCHGKGTGQNGFRLSLRGYAPEMDHEWLTREYGGRRISPTDPESSTLIRKAGGLAPHEGGKLLEKGDRAYTTLVNWIRAGAPGPKKNDPTVRSLTATPASLTLRPGESRRLAIQATFSDGQRRDVTWLSRFESNDPGMAEIDSTGLVRVRRHGETAVRAMFQGEVAVVIVTAPHEKPVAAERLAKKNNFIDEHVFAKLAALRIEPSDLCGDAEFLRRAHLDTIGVLPTPSEVRAFLADTKPDKRNRLIDSLLDRPEFVDHWALFLGDLLQNRKERDHDVRGTKGVRGFHAWLHKQVKANRPWDQLARDVLLAKGKCTEQPAVGYYIVTIGEQPSERSAVIDSVAQAFLGTRIGCARCHNHPLERYTQDDFYHFAGFFSRVRLERKDPKQGPTILWVAGTKEREPNLAKSPIGVTQPRTGAFLPPRPLDRATLPPPKPGDDPRVALVDWMTSPKNEYFSGAMVNRLWKHFLGVGLVEPVDDLRASNPPSNPALWSALNKEFVRAKFDLKHVMRLILQSRTYQLASTTRGNNSRDTRFYSHYFARRLPAEVLLDALSAATGVPDQFAGYPVGLRAGQLPDPGLRSYFLTLFGRSERVTACACERSGDVTMPQLLHLQNGESVIVKIRSPEGRLAKLLNDKKSDGEVIEELFLATLSRLPTEANKSAIRKSLAAGDRREEVFRDLFWALVNAKEFAFNH
jgi:hypothetical protein